MGTSYLQTLVLGAGASFPYDFPLSDALVDGIRRNLPQAASETAALLNRDRRLVETHTRPASAFATALKGLTAVSIDKFLNLNQQWLDIGRMAIIIELLRREKSSLYPGASGIQGDWYNYLFSKLIEGLDTVEAIKAEFGTGVRIVTFNYDRSLENFVHKNLSVLLSATLTKEEIAQIASRLEIVHVYGSIGRLPWQTDTQLGSIVEYGDFSEDVYSRSEKIRNNIQLIYDQRTTLDQLEKAKSFIYPANRVLVLGFGFDEKNIENLDLRNTLNGKLVFATGYKMTTNERLHARNQLSLNKISAAQKNDINIIDADCLLLCREHLLSRVS